MRDKRVDHEEREQGQNDERKPIDWRGRRRPLHYAARIARSPPSHRGLSVRVCVMVGCVAAGVKGSA